MEHIYLTETEKFSKKLSQFNKQDAAIILSSMVLISENRYVDSRFEITSSDDGKNHLNLKLTDNRYEIIYSQVSDIEIILWDIGIAN